VLLLVVLHGQTPRGVIGTRLGTTFGAWLNELFRRALQCPRLLEAPMPSFFHVSLPLSSMVEQVVTG
jgi:hypothetical protein